METNLIEEIYSVAQEFFEDKEDSLEEFTCVICQNIPMISKAVEISCCHHIFCKNCLMKWINRNGRCPLCKAEINKSEFENKCSLIKESNKILCRLFSKIKLKCPKNCTWQGNLEQFEEHAKKCFIKRKCMYSDYGCTFVGLVNEIVDHENQDDKNHLQLLYNHLQNHNKKNPGIFNIEVDCHEHPLKLYYRDKNATKFGCNLGYYSQDSRCPMGNQLLPGSSFRCGECDFDLCTSCLYNHLKK